MTDIHTRPTIAAENDDVIDYGGQIRRALGDRLADVTADRDTWRKLAVTFAIAFAAVTVATVVFAVKLVP